jgi:hypothetical protein
MTLVKVDRDSLVEDLYLLKSKIPVENTDAREHLTKIIEHIIHSPNLESQTNHARIKRR